MLAQPRKCGDDLAFTDQRGFGELEFQKSRWQPIFREHRAHQKIKATFFDLRHRDVHRHANGHPGITPHGGLFDSGAQNPLAHRHDLPRLLG